MVIDSIGEGIAFALMVIFIFTLTGWYVKSSLAMCKMLKDMEDR